MQLNQFLESIHYLCVFMSLFYLIDVLSQYFISVCRTVTSSLGTVPLASKKHANTFGIVITYERFDIYIYKHQWPNLWTFGTFVINVP